MRSDWQYFTNLGIKYVTNHPEVFEEYLESFREGIDKSGLKRVDNNTIIPFVSDFKNDVIDHLNDISYERFLEWGLA